MQICVFTRGLGARAALAGRPAERRRVPVPPRRAPCSRGFRTALSVRTRVDHAIYLPLPIFLFLSPFAPRFIRRSSRAGVPSALFAFNRG
jgi:hypothetical protein